MLRRAEPLTLAVFCCCISESQHMQFVFFCIMDAMILGNWWVPKG